MNHEIRVRVPVPTHNSIRDVLHRANGTEAQLDVLMRADVLFAGTRCGRYYGGTLTADEVERLTPKVSRRG